MVRLQALALKKWMLKVVGSLCISEAVYRMVDGLCVLIINKKLKAEIAVSDVVQAGFIVSNSEGGLGSFSE